MSSISGVLSPLRLLPASQLCALVPDSCCRVFGNLWSCHGNRPSAYLHPGTLNLFPFTLHAVAAIWCHATTRSQFSVPSEAMLKAEAAEPVKLPVTVHVWVCTGPPTSSPQSSAPPWLGGGICGLGIRCLARGWDEMMIPPLSRHLFSSPLLPHFSPPHLPYTHILTYAYTYSPLNILLFPSISRPFVPP